MKHLASICIFLLVASQSLFSQDLPGGIKFPIEEEMEKRCGSYQKVILEMPKEVKYRIEVGQYYDLFFVMDDADWFNKIFSSKTDGIALDIITNEHYDCAKTDKEIEEYSAKPIRGDLQAPIYLKQLKKGMQKTKTGVKIKLGRLPKDYVGKKIEFNILIIKKEYICDYTVNTSTKASNWELVDMGYFIDSVQFQKKYTGEGATIDTYINENQILTVELPLLNDTTQNIEADVQALYSANALQNYNIKKVKIHAFTSVEGNADENVMILENTATNISQAFKAIGGSQIISEVFASENWLGFFSDIVKTPYSALAKKTKPEIREALEKPEVIAAISPYFPSHKVAIITFELQKKDIYKDLLDDTLVTIFDSFVKEGKAEEAMVVTSSMYSKVINNVISSDLYDKLEIPDDKNLAALHNKKAIYNFFMGNVPEKATLDSLLVLQEKYPTEGSIRYNVCIFKFDLWQKGELEDFEHTAFQKEISGLSRYKVNATFVKRMLLNYYMLATAIYEKEGDAKMEDKSIKTVNSSYKSAKLSDHDYLQVARYFVANDQIDFAQKMLSKKVTDMDVSEEILFYYLDITIENDKLTSKADYRKFMENALTANKERFCGYFTPPHEGGVSFQLLKDKYLRKTYCENCGN